MNKLPVAQRAQILSMLCEGASMRSVSRLADVSFNTVAKLLLDAGSFCAGYHDANVKGVKAKRVQVDEIWSFTYAKQKNVATAKAAPDGAGDTWTWTAIEAETQAASFRISLAVAMATAPLGSCKTWPIALPIASS